MAFLRILSLAALLVAAVLAKDDLPKVRPRLNCTLTRAD
jgi:hypothetical protein